MERPTRAETARQSWERTDDLKERDPIYAILVNYVRGRQLKAALDIVRTLEDNFVKGETSLRYNELWHQVIEHGNIKQTIRKTLVKLREEGIAINEGADLFKVRHKKKKKRTRKGKFKELKKPQNKGGKGSMLGWWKISWETYSTRHQNFSDLAVECNTNLLERTKIVKK